MKIRYDQVSARAARLERKLSKPTKVPRKPIRKDMSYWIPWLPGMEKTK